MRSLTSSLVMFALAGGIVGVVALGCSADGSANIGGDDTSTANTDPTGNAPPSGTGSPSGTPTSSGGPPVVSSDDGGSNGFDAGPPPPPPGTACTTANQVYTRTCGFCGTQTAICTIPDPDSGVDAGDSADGGGLVVSDYSACSGEVANGCTPGTSKTAACGNCGTQNLICQNNCTYASTVCAGEPKNACSPGSITNTSAGCGTDGSGNQEFRQETCSPTCALGAAGACGPFVNTHVIAISGTAKGIVNVNLDMEVTTGQSFTLYGFASCPDTDPTDITDNSPSDYVEVDNNTAKTASITAYTTQATGAPEVVTAIFTYAGKVPPLNDTARLNCNFGVSDYCEDGVNLCGPDSDEYFADLEGISIPPGGSVIVWVGSDDDMTTGPVVLNLRTDTLK